jgi:adenosylcobinamide kinase/adenosylcobinamide-phosphate guanylyltransferase
MTTDDPTLTLILGGARSGKSTYAESLATKLGRRVLYVATAEALDDEMRARVAAHQERRPSDWLTLEAPEKVGAALQASPAATAADAILLDCLTLLVSNLILAKAGESDEGGAPDAPESDVDLAWATVEAELEALLEAHRLLGSHLIVVSNEVGLGVVPAYSLGRTYRDCLGRANQALAQVADRVILMVAGLPVDLGALPLAGDDEGARTAT